MVDSGDEGRRAAPTLSRRTLVGLAVTGAVGGAGGWTISQLFFEGDGGEERADGTGSPPDTSAEQQDAASAENPGEDRSEDPTEDPSADTSDPEHGETGERPSDQEEGTDQTDPEGTNEDVDDGTGVLDVDAVVYVKTSRGIRAVDAADGSDRWLGGRQFDWVSDAPTVADGTVYAGAITDDDGGAVFALDADTGDHRWTFDEPDDAVRTAVTVVGDTAYAGSQDDSLYAIDRRTGARRWRFDAPSAVQAAPAVVDGSVYVASGLDLFSLDVDGGTVQWRISPVRLSGIGTPQVVDGTVYVAANRSVFAVDADTGASVWETPLGTDVGGLRDVVHHDGSLYVGGPGNPELFALDAGSGRVRWSFDEPRHGIEGAPTVVDGTVFANFGDFTASGGAALYAVDAADGTERWSYRSDDEVVGHTPTVYEGVLYTGGPDGDVYAFDTASGERLWSTTLGRSTWATAPTVVADPSGGYGVGSRARLGTHGHHERAQF